MFFEKCVSMDSLLRGWQKVLSNRGAAGGDGIGIEDFAATASLRLARLSRDLRSGDYVPGPFRTIKVPKKQGGTRVLSIPCIIDRIVQTAAAEVLGPDLDSEMEEASFGYRPGKSVQNAIDRVSRFQRQGYEWVVDGDIEDYFGSIPHDRLLARLERSIDDDAMIDLVSLWLEGFSPNGRGVPQGSPISPLLSNLYLDDIDEAIEGKGVRLVRFADDFLLLCQDQALAGAAEQRMADLLAEQGLRLNPEKTRITRFDAGFRFLGHLFVRSMALASREDAQVALSMENARAKEPNNPQKAPIQEMNGHDTVTDAAWDSLLTPAATKNASKQPASLDDVLSEDMPDQSSARAPRLRVLYMVEPGRRLTLRNQAFSIHEHDREILAVPHQRVDRIDIGPGVSIDTEALRHALATDTAVAFVNGRGGTDGLLVANGWLRASLHMAQARLTLDQDRRLSVARAIVEGRIRNQRALLHRLNRRRKDGRITEVLKIMSRPLRRLQQATAIDALMGFEGEAAALYWPALGHCLEMDWRLDNRYRDPPRNPVNAVLNLLSSFLYRDVGTLLSRRGLHASIGILHTTRDGHDALASDMMEEFRAPLVEGLCIYIFNNRLLNADDFHRDQSEGTVRIGRYALKQCIQEWERWLDRPIKSPRSGKTVLWRGLIAEQIDELVCCLLEESPYHFYKMDY